MGEGKRDRSGQRQRSSHGVDVKSSSDSELAQGKGKGRRTKAKERWPFLEGLTVDELARYRRRRFQGHSKDNLGPCAQAADENHLTEYRRAFRVSSEDIFKDSDPSGKEKQEEVETEEKLSIEAIPESKENMQTERENPRPTARPAPIRRGTSLRREGQFYGDTETYSSYVPHQGLHRPELVRRPTSLRMEGEIDTMTEKCEKFIEWLNVSRPELIRLPTNLKLEGHLETSTENQEKYVPFVGARRPELLRQGTNLKLEGESFFLPEYSDVFKEHLITGRQVIKKPESHLRTGEEFYQPAEISKNLLDPREKEIQLMAKLTQDVEEEERKRKEEEEEKKQEEINLLISKLEELKGPPLEVPEYKASYKDFPRERPKVVRPEDEIGRADGSKVTSSPVRSKFMTKIDQDPEYKSRYLDCPRDRTIYQKPPIGPRPSQSSSRRSSGAFAKPTVHHHESRRFELENFGREVYADRDVILPASEVKSQYVSHGRVPRVETTRIPTSLRLEGNLDLQPEYRNAYCSKRDYHSSDNHHVSRRRDRSTSSSRKKENYWLSNNNSEHFGQINAAQDQDAFQILHTRVHEDSVVGKPPPGSRRASQVQIHRPTHMEFSDGTSVHARSPSPTYRLHVCNVDDEPRGFGRRRRSSSSVQSSSRVDRSSSPDVHETRDEAQRPYSPSFGRQTGERKSFVVLDRADEHGNEHGNELGRRRMDRNCNVVDLSSALGGRQRTPNNWMPPWYDSTNAI